jgi:thiol-disulfide isomerase/thioredoxin
MKSVRTVTAAALLIVLAAAAWLAWHGPAVRAMAPPVSYTLLDGSPHRLDELRGKVVLVNFWATSCAICMAEMPQIIATHRQYAPRGYDTLAVAMHYDPPALVSRFAQTRQLPFGVVIDNTGGIARDFGDVRLTPTTFVLNKRGEIVKRYVGAPDFTELHKLLEGLLADT